MQINVAQLLKESVGSNRSYQLDKSIGADNISSVKGNLTLTRTKSGIMVNGEMTATVTGICSRCLKQIDYKIDYTLTEEFSSSMDTSKDQYLPGEPDRPTIDDSHVLDLSEVIRQYAVLTMPVKPLCNSDCAGICPSCGHDLNQGHCKCPPQAPDQRWAKLVRLRKESRV
ncbi:MAG: DUF177 domain-containing protein [Chloroflexi bacterium]|nr:DUF177 domain-containing protein [Chloroflexota bacterium]